MIPRIVAPVLVFLLTAAWAVAQTATAPAPAPAPPPAPAASAPAAGQSGTTHRTQGADFASANTILDLSMLMSARVTDPSDPDDAWMTVPAVNNSTSRVTRVLVADEQLDAALAITAPSGRTFLRQVAASDASVVVERATAFGRRAYRVVLPPVHSATLALHFANAGTQPTVYAWTEAALIAHNRHAAVLSGVVAGLLAAAAAFAAGAAAVGSRPFANWAAAFLGAVLFADLAATGVFDRGWFEDPGGPYGLMALALALALAAGIRLVDFVAPFEAFKRGTGKWRDRIAILVLLLGAAAFAGVPGVGLAVRALAVIGAALAAGYLAHCGRLGVSTARRLAPAATVFALVTAAATFHALGFFGGSILAPAAIGGFSAAGAMLVALACAVGGYEPAVVRLKALRDHKLRAEAATDDVSGRETAAVSASHQGVFDLDLATGLLSLSAEAAAILGLPSGAFELNREAWVGRIHPEDRAVYQEALTTYRHKPGFAFRLEFRARGIAGRIRWFELRATMTGQASEAERCLGLIADVTVRKSHESVQEPADAPVQPQTQAPSTTPAAGAANGANGATAPNALDADLARALEKGEIDVHYQPIMRMRDGTVGGFEALIRWTHPKKGAISPDDFVPRAEQTGAIAALGRYVLKRAAEDLARWQKFFPLKPPLFVNVNVSWRQLSDESFFKDVEAILGQTGVAPGTLKLELTEGAVMKDTERAAAALKRLKQMGAGLAIDDFGTGTSALAQLGKFPFDTIKIDKSFLSGARDKRREALLTSVVTLAHELKFEVIAEGVEREQDARQLRALAVEYAQGYMFSHPIPAGEVTGFVAMTYAG